MRARQIYRLAVHLVVLICAGDLLGRLTAVLGVTLVVVDVHRTGATHRSRVKAHVSVVLGVQVHAGIVGDVARVVGALTHGQVDIVSVRLGGVQRDRSKLCGNVVDVVHRHVHLHSVAELLLHRAGAGRTCRRGVATAGDILSPGLVVYLLRQRRSLWSSGRGTRRSSTCSTVAVVGLVRGAPVICRQLVGLGVSGSVRGGIGRQRARGGGGRTDNDSTCRDVVMVQVGRGLLLLLCLLGLLLLLVLLLLCVHLVLLLLGAAGATIYIRQVDRARHLLVAGGSSGSPAHSPGGLGARVPRLWLRHTHRRVSLLVLLLLLLLLVVMLLLAGNVVSVEDVRNGLRGHGDGLLARHRHVAGRDPAVVAATALGTDTAVVVSVDVIIVAGLVMPVSTRVACTGRPLRGRGGSSIPLPGQPTSSNVAGVARSISVASISGVIARHVGEIGVARVVASVPAK